MHRLLTMPVPWNDLCLEYCMIYAGKVESPWSLSLLTSLLLGMHHHWFWFQEELSSHQLCMLEMGCMYIVDTDCSSHTCNVTLCGHVWTVSLNARVGLNIKRNWCWLLSELCLKMCTTLLTEFAFVACCRHRWLHYMTDDPPSETDLPHRKWMLPHTENLSGTDQRYIPYSTTRPKIEAWKPPQAKW